MKIRDVVFITSVICLPLKVGAGSKVLLANEGKRPTKATETILFKFQNSDGEMVYVVTDKDTGKELFRIKDGVSKK